MKIRHKMLPTKHIYVHFHVYWSFTSCALCRLEDGTCMHIICSTFIHNFLYYALVEVSFEDMVVGCHIGA
jgi:hypothetical protein